MSADKRERLHKTLKKYAIVLGVAVVYLIFVLSTGWGLPCLFFEITRLRCPACGVSRMLLALLRLDFVAAFRYNPYLFVNAPVILFCLGYSEIQYVRTGSRIHPKWVSVILWCEIGLALLFGVLRNLPIWL